MNEITQTEPKRHCNQCDYRDPCNISSILVMGKELAADSGKPGICPVYTSDIALKERRT